MSKILATVDLPLRVSFGSTDEPKLEMRFRLLDSKEPLTFALILSPIYPFVNCIKICKKDSGEEVRLPTVDAHRKSAPDLTIDQEHRDSFVTLLPQQDILVKSGTFRPLGNEIYDSQRIAQMGAARYRFLQLGMHLLDVGEQYTIQIKPGLKLYQWMKGTREDLASSNDGSGTKWVHTKDPIDVVAGVSVSFKVEA